MEQLLSLGQTFNPPETAWGFSPLTEKKKKSLWVAGQQELLVHLGQNGLKVRENSVFEATRAKPSQYLALKKGHFVWNCSNRVTASKKATESFVLMRSKHNSLGPITSTWARDNGKNFLSGGLPPHPSLSSSLQLKP